MLRHVRQFSIAVVLALAASARAADKITYEDHLLPILRNECTSCHNPDKKKAGLDLSTYQSTLAGGDSGPVAAASDPDASLLYKVVAHLDDPKMPKGKAKLADKDINIFRQWIAGGLLENAGGKAVASSKPKVNLAVASITSARPAGPIAMPRDLSLDPVVYTKRPGALMCMAASPWAPLVAVGGRHQVLLYDTNSLDLLGVLPFAEGDPYVTRFSRNGSTLLVGGGVSAKSGHVVLFDVATGRRITQVGDEFDAVLAADISPDQSTVALGGPGKTLKLYSTADGQLLHVLKKHTDWLTAIAYSPDGVLLASGDRQGGLWVWESQSANEFYSLTGHKAAITSLCFRDDSNVLASVSEDGSVKLWDMPTGKLVKTWNAHPPGVTSVSFTHDGRLVTCGRDKVVRQWKPDGTALATTAAFPDIALHATFDGDGRRIIAGDWSGAIRVFDAQSARPIGEITADPPPLKDRLAAAGHDLSDAQADFEKQAAAMNTASKKLADSKSTIAKLQAAQERSDLAAKLADMERIRTAAQKAQDAANKSVVDLRAAEALVSDGPRLISDRQIALARDQEALAQTITARDAAAIALERRIKLAREIAQVAQHLSDAGRALPEDRDLNAASVKAKALFDSVNSAVESADRSVVSRTHAIEVARVTAARSQAAAVQESVLVAAASQLIASLKQAVESTGAEARKQAAAEHKASTEVELARARLNKIAPGQTTQGESTPATQPVARKT
jgi:hypothetical protein